MYKIIIIIILIFIPNLAVCQYVASTLQQRIDNDNNSINLDLADIQAKNADIQSIVNDQQANQVTSQVPDIQIILNPGKVTPANAVIDQPTQ